MISVIVPVYKVEEYLRQCVDSIINQTYQDLDIILIDDGSPDKCGEICDEYAKKDDRIKVFHTENRGISAARNLGIDVARGEYIGFVDSDDWIEPDMYEILFRKAKENNADMSMCGVWYESTTSTISFIQDGLYNGEDNLVALIERVINPHVCNKLFCKTVFDYIRFPDNHYFEDMAIIHHIMSAVSTTILIGIPKYHYRQRKDSIVKNHSAKYLLDYAHSYVEQFYFFKNNEVQLFESMEEQILKIAALGVSRVWRWWHKCSCDEKRSNKQEIIELQSFTKKNFRLFGYREWPLYLRVSTFFMHYTSKTTFAIMYHLNQIYRRIRPQKANIVK